jgi:hypothetical protein
MRIETAAILDIFQYRPQTSDFSIVYSLSLPAMWSGYVIVFRGCFRNRGCFTIATVLRTAGTVLRSIGTEAYPDMHESSITTYSVSAASRGRRHVPRSAAAAAVSAPLPAGPSPSDEAY